MFVFGRNFDLFGQKFDLFRSRIFKVIQILSALTHSPFRSPDLYSVVARSNGCYEEEKNPNLNKFVKTDQFSFDSCLYIFVDGAGMKRRKIKRRKSINLSSDKMSWDEPCVPQGLEMVRKQARLKSFWRFIILFTFQLWLGLQLLLKGGTVILLTSFLGIRTRDLSALDIVWISDSSTHPFYVLVWLKQKFS